LTKNNAATIHESVRPNLKKIQICASCSDSLFLENCTRLEYLAFSGNISLPILETMTNLKTLLLDQNVEIPLQILTKFQNLTELNYGMSFAKNLEAMRQYLPNLEKIKF